jgi:hypothetical protein
MHQRSLPVWFKLLDHDRRRLSLPFLIGALRESSAIPSGGADYEQVYQLFQDMASYRIARSRHFPGEKNLVVYLQVCAFLEVPVFSICPEKYAREWLALYPSNKPENSHLCFDPGVAQEEALDLEGLAQRVFKGWDHSIALSSKLYSRERKGPKYSAKWRKFDGSDWSTIRAALGQAEVA